MKKEIQMPSEGGIQSRKTDQVRDFFTALLATVAFSAAAFGIFGKLVGINKATFSMQESSQKAVRANAIFRSFAQETSPSMSSYDTLLAEINQGITSSPELYVAAAKELLGRGAGTDAKTIIQAGEIAHPDDPIMTIGSIDVRAATGDAESAWTELAQTGDTSNPEIMSRLIKYGTTAAKVDETMAILGDLGNLPWTPTTEDWSNLVNMLTEAGRIEEAKIAAQYSPEAAQLEAKLEAFSKLSEGSFQEAEELIKAYIASIATPTPEDWAILAEAFAGNGDLLQSANAYREAEGLKIEAIGGNVNSSGVVWDFLAG